VALVQRESSRSSHALASFQSSNTVCAETPRTSAVSSAVRPPKTPQLDDAGRALDLAPPVLSGPRRAPSARGRAAIRPKQRCPGPHHPLARLRVGRFPKKRSPVRPTSLCGFPAAGRWPILGGTAISTGVLRGHHQLRARSSSPRRMNGAGCE